MPQSESFECRMASGEDDVSNGTLKNFLLKLLVNLTTIFNTVFSLICSPSRWIYARIIPALKLLRAHHTAEGYRPIYFFSTISQVLETMVLARISDHLCSSDSALQIRVHVTTAFNRK
ncbi:hypothetical protein Trydic_g16667 [Trypoxylus dichotomus]